MKIEPIRSSETSAINTQLPGNYPKKEHITILLHFSKKWSSICKLRSAPCRCILDQNIERCIPNAFARDSSWFQKITTSLLTSKQFPNERQAELNICTSESISGSCEYTAVATQHCTARFELKQTECRLFCGYVGFLNFWAPRFLYIGQAFRYSPENAFYIFNQKIYFSIRYSLDRASLK